MESINGFFISTFTSSFQVVLLVVLLGIFFLVWRIKIVFNNRKIHHRLLEIAFERGMMNEKSSLIQKNFLKE